MPHHQPSKHKQFTKKAPPVRRSFVCGAHVPNSDDATLLNRSQPAWRGGPDLSPIGQAAGAATVSAPRRIVQTGHKDSPLLWGILAAVLRFVHYIGALISAVFPLAVEAAVECQCRARKLLFSLIVLTAGYPQLNFISRDWHWVTTAAHRVAAWDDRVVKRIRRYCGRQSDDNRTPFDDRLHQKTCLADQARGCDYDAGDECS